MMNYITTTGLRTQSPQFVDTLRKGGSVSLIHRSEIVGIIKPAQDKPKKFDVSNFKKIIEGLNLPKTTYAERDRIYRKHLMKKYGKNIS